MRKMWTLISKLIRDFFIIGWNYSFLFSFYGVLWWLCFYVRTPLSFRLSSWALKKKTVWLDRYFENRYRDVLCRFSDSVSCAENPAETPRIWVFWGQGEAKMPPLVQACYRQLTAFNVQVTLVTNENLEQYIQLPRIIYSKVADGRISWANFSDIVRNTLLTCHGGLWLDATVWTSGKLPLGKLMSFPFYSANGYVPLTSRSICFWTSLGWNWSSWCLWSSQKNNLLFAFVSTMLQTIAERETAWPDYVIQDYLIYAACRRYSSVAEEMERCREMPCQMRNELAVIMNRPYDESEYRRLCEQNFVFKLSFRAPWRTETSNGRMTFYGKILSSPFEIR